MCECRRSLVAIQFDRSGPSKSTGEGSPTLGGLWEQMGRNGTGTNARRQLAEKSGRVLVLQVCHGVEHPVGAATESGKTRH
jgi:hypothetical protein